ncbi:MAG TPA: HAMP domain-containing sensor histidine kinase, partial [Chroococcales cyanobacterium]
DLLLEQKLGPLNEQQMGIFSLLRNSTDGLLDLIGTLLEVYRYEGGRSQLHLENVQINRVIRDCVNQLIPIAEQKGVNLTAALSLDVDNIIADEMALKRVFMNLLDNAIKFTDRGGTVQIDSELHERYVIVSVKDSGVGISDEDLKFLYQRFGQTRSGKKVKSGTGLGLYLSRQIIEAHGGTIVCASTEGVGTTFIVCLPLSQPAAAS